jgi:hypothetical protein
MSPLTFLGFFSHLLPEELPSFELLELLLLTILHGFRHWVVEVDVHNNRLLFWREEVFFFRLLIFLSASFSPLSSIVGTFVHHEVFFRFTSAGILFVKLVVKIVVTVFLRSIAFGAQRSITILSFDSQSNLLR